MASQFEAVKTRSATCVVIMGVAGAGKTTIGQLLAKRVSGNFFDADDVHSTTSINKLRNGVALSDADRISWLERVVQRMSEMMGDAPTVVACSALKEAYRVRLAANPYHLVYLEADRNECARRLRLRTGHFADQRLLPTQFRDLEVPDSAIVIPATWTPNRAVNHVIRELGHLNGMQAADSADCGPGSS